MAYTKPLVTITVYYHGGENPVVFADAISDGETVRYGSNVRNQLLHGDTIESVGKIGEGDAAKYVIPYHAVIYATVAVADSAEQTKPQDDFCVKE